MSPHCPPDYGPAVELCSICGRALVSRIYNTAAPPHEHFATCWVCEQCDLIPEPRQYA